MSFDKNQFPSYTIFMQIAVIGTGYVGLVTGAIFADLGNDVFCIDIDQKKINNLKKGISPIYEPGLDDLVKRNYKEGRLNFTTDIDRGVRNAEVIFIGVGTPSREDGSVNLDYVKQAATDIGKALAKVLKKDQFYRVIVDKSTVPIGTGDMVSDIIKKYFRGGFDVVSNPEFLREGQAISDCQNPDRIVIGNGSRLRPTDAKAVVGRQGYGGQAGDARKIMEKLYSPYKCEKLFTDVKTAEMIKYASNAYLATSISFINSVAKLCEAVGADVSKVAQGMRLDKRIGKNAFLDAGPGYGGSCFPKDVKGLVDIAHQNNVNLPILDATEEVNINAKNAVIEKIKSLIGSPNGKKIAIWGLAFKANTDDIREAPVLPLLDWLTKEKAKITAFDPVAEENIAKEYKFVKFAKTPYEIAKNADIIVIMTEWDEFRSINLKRVKNLMKTPKMVDMRNIYGINEMKELGFEYTNIGNVR